MYATLLAEIDIVERKLADRFDAAFILQPACCNKYGSGRLGECGYTSTSLLRAILTKFCRAAKITEVSVTNCNEMSEMNASMMYVVTYYSPLRRRDLLRHRKVDVLVLRVRFTLRPQSLRIYLCTRTATSERHTRAQHDRSYIWRGIHG